MQENSEGFLYPVIVEDLCVDCDLCRKVCPANGFVFTHPAEPDCYAVMASDELRRGSSSGAFFPVLALHVLEQGGHVCGAAFDENMALRHRIVSCMKDLDCLRGSKYLQSSLGDTFRQVKSLLEKGDLVLFTGTPCQIAGLASFLKNDWNNLITADLICHGVPSQKVFDNYLASEFPGEKVLHTDFRDKKDGWGVGSLTTTTTTTQRKRSLKDFDDPFLQAFFANVSLRECCYGCAYACMPRTGDFTMADFWGVPKEMDDRKGTSQIFVNSAKAAQIWQAIRPAFMKVKAYPASLPVSIQPNLRHGSERHPARKVFFKEIAMGTPLKNTLQKSVYSTKNVALLNFHWENVNFGAVLTSYALNAYLNEQGYFAQNINYIPRFPWIADEPENPLFDAFRHKHMPMTRLYQSGDSLDELNDSFSTFIVGSDQVWRHTFIRNDKDAYFFSFASPDKKLMAYAASFGTAVLEADADDNKDYAQRLALFDSVTVRENSGVSLCRELGREATQVVDPVFLLTQTHWKKLADEGFCADSINAVVYYTINEQLAGSIQNFIASNNTLAACPPKGSHLRPWHRRMAPLHTALPFLRDRLVSRFLLCHTFQQAFRLCEPQQRHSDSHGIPVRKPWYRRAAVFQLRGSPSGKTCKRRDRLRFRQRQTGRTAPGIFPFSPRSFGKASYSGAHRGKKGRQDAMAGKPVCRRRSSQKLYSVEISAVQDSF